MDVPDFPDQPAELPNAPSHQTSSHNKRWSLYQALTTTEIIVVWLMKFLLDAGRHVVTDNWYTSLRLVRYLLSRDTMLTGVVRSDRGPPE